LSFCRHLDLLAYLTLDVGINRTDFHSNSCVYPKGGDPD
jgi:hypothetical protein